MVSLVFIVGIQSGYGQDTEAFFSAAHDGDVVALKSYLDNGGDIDVVDYTGTTALLMAIVQNKMEAVEVLLKNGANVNICDGMNYTALLEAVLKNKEFSIKYVELLLEKGANVNVQTIPEKHTPLMFAAEEGDIEVVKLLVKKGADTKLKDSLDKTAVQKAIKNRHKEVVKFLSQITDDPQTEKMIKERMKKRESNKKNQN